MPLKRIHIPPVVKAEGPPKEGPKTELSPIRMIVHDLRSKLNHIIGFSEIVLDAIESLDRPLLCQDLLKVRHAAIHLNSLLNANLYLPKPNEPEHSAEWIPLRLAVSGPLNQIIGYTEMIEEETLQPELISQRQDVQQVAMSAQQFWNIAQASGLVLPRVAVVEARSNAGEAFLFDPSSKPKGQSFGHLLIVEDEELNRDVLFRRLTREGYDVDCATHANMAMRMMHETPYDLVLLDVMMPGKDGFELLIEIRNDPTLRHLPVVMLSAFNEVDRVASCIEAGADDYLSKPFNSVLLRARIAACLEKKRLRDSEIATWHTLHAETNRLAVTLASIADAVITTDSNQAITMMNGEAERLLQWNADDGTGRQIDELLPLWRSGQEILIEGLVAAVLEKGEPISYSAGIETATRKGKRVPIALRATPLRSDDGFARGVVVVAHDNTEHEKLAQEMLRSSKLESLSILAGGIAHEYNNILTSIFGQLALAQTEPLTPTLAERIGQTELSALRARDLTRQLLTFANGGDPVRRKVDIEDLVRCAANFANRSPGVYCQFEFEPKLPKGEVDADQMSQVIHNLISNAQQSMPQGGQIRIHARSIVLEQETLSMAAGQYIRISIADDGLGITEENIGRIFDPFFSTKPNAAGLGLSAAYSIVRKHFGTIEVVSPSKGGAIFHVWIPATTDAPTEPVTRRDVVGSGSGRILVMDDEQQIRTILKEMLSLAGYEVNVAETGEEALRLFNIARQVKRPFDAVIMDLIIPHGMGGREAIAKLREIDTNVPVLVSSGYSNDPVMARHRDFGFSGVLAKPYRMMDMLNTIAEMISVSRAAKR